MKYINMETWPRRRHFEFFNKMDSPHLNITANLDVTRLYGMCKRKNVSFFQVFLYLVTKTANEIREFRFRIREGGVLEHERIDVSFTAPASDDLFSFCTAEYYENLSHFLEHVSDRLEQIQGSVELDDQQGKDEVIFTTCIPWVSYTAITHPIHLSPADSIPRFAWGKFFQENEKLQMPFSVQAHHALVDGLHVGQFFQSMQEKLNVIDL
ncbi:chloramphenicol acetyltransferase [Peribacillus kribbensis]|uniref:chloramphenicol acetyltransferase n=1 Tax=Peribacillus kribbensis TaxID=356658 RepID=UPI00041C6647|nr:chloramphenicol acetyltransferase [Peribacillus kribbensis]